jgi:hypothetical protein
MKDEEFELLKESIKQAGEIKKGIHTSQIFFSELEPINFQTLNDWKDQGAMRFFYFHRRPLRHR